jgi:hypothetical protein
LEVLRHLHEAHALEQRAKRRRIGRCVFDELEAVGSHGVDLVDRSEGLVLDAGHLRPPELTAMPN